MESAPSHPTGHRTNMLSAFTYYSDFSVEIPYQPGNIVISDTRIEGADKLFHYNRSGNELWQTNRPLKNIFFEHVVAKDLAKPTVLYGEKDFGVTAVFSDVHLTVREGCETTPLFWTCNYDAITFDNVAVEGGNDVPLIQTWSEGKISIKNLLCKPERSELIEKLRCPFEVKRI